MRKHVCRWVLGLTALLAIPARGSAQQRPVELGMDGGVQVSLTGGTSPLVQIPTGLFRVGFFANDLVSVEPSVALTMLTGSGETAQLLQGRLGVLVHFASDPTKSRGFVEPLVGIIRRAGPSKTQTQFSAGGGIGVKIPAGKDFAARLEAVFTHGFSSNSFSGGNAVGALIGFSFFTH